MCTSQMSSWDGDAKGVEQRVGFAMTARSPIERILQYGEQRGWRNLKLYSDTSGEYTRDYVSAEDADMNAYNVFTRRGGIIRHFWSGEGGPEPADPGQDPHDAPDMSPLWTILDTTPEGRGTDWYPSLRYGRQRIDAPFVGGRRWFAKCSELAEPPRRGSAKISHGDV